jgi:putative transposase
MNIVKVFKGVSSLTISKRFPELREQMWRGVLWSPSYYVGTAGHVSAEVIERYIKEQERHSSTG